MERRMMTWHSPVLDREMTVAAWGHWGRPVVLFATAASDALDYERFKLIHVLKPLMEAGHYTTYKQLAAAESYEFDRFTPGSAVDSDGDGAAESCVDGSTCVLGGMRYLDFDGDGQPDGAFGDRDFNVVSLRGNAVLRWEYRPGSTLFLVWQQRRYDRRAFGDFDFGRDRADMVGLQPDNVFIIKLNYWLGL